MPINSFWTANDKIPIAQKRVSVPSENGLEYGAGQKIVIDIPPTIQYIQPRESYLQLDVKLAVPAGENARLMLDSTLGGQVLLRDVRVYSGGVGNVLLEEYQNYNVITALKYDYETNDTLRAKRALTEGAQTHSIECRGSMGTTTSHQNDCATNPYFKAHAGTAANTFDNDDFKTVKCLLPINTGIFSNDKVFPVLMTEGLKLEIILERDVNVFRNLDQSVKQRKLQSNPLFHSINGSDTAPTNASTVGTFASFYVTRDNNMTGTPQFPFVVGQKIGFQKTDGTDTTTFTVAPVISQIELDAAAGDFGLVKITVSPAMNIATLPPTNREFVLWSETVFTVAPTYTVSNVELILQQLTMPDGYTRKMMGMMKEGGSMNYDFLSFTNYKYSQLSSDTVANIRLPFSQSRAKAVLCIPTDATNRTSQASIQGNDTYLINSEPHDVRNHTDRSGLVGITDNLQNYQFFYDGKLNPSRKVSTSKLAAKNSIDQVPLIELEKALAQSKIIPYSFRAFQSNFCVGRALSLQDGVYDTRNKDFNLQVEYSGTGGDFNKLWNCWISHIRTIVFAGGGIQVLI